MAPTAISTLALALSLALTLATSSACSPCVGEAEIAPTLLAVHNGFREAHGVLPMTWNSSLAESAELWSSLCLFEHSPMAYGENIVLDGVVRPSHETIASMVTRWYAWESHLYNYSNPGYSPSTGHFTQMVWRSTREVGCAIADECLCPDGIWTRGRNDTFRASMLVCQYSPAGNFAGGFAENVLRPT